MLSKARRGELIMPLPVGLAYDAAGHVVLDPDTAVQGALTHLFATFEATGSATACVKAFRAAGLSFPWRHLKGPRKGEIDWQPLAHHTVLRVLHNPRYAGCFTYGRHRHQKLPSGKWSSTILAREQWISFIPGAHPGYITLDQYDANIARLAANSPLPAGHAGGAAREGAAWLQGLLRCGRCGRLMQVVYHSSGSPAYRCGRANQMYGARSCQRTGGRRLHETVLAELLAALAPASLAATVQAMAGAQAQHRQNLAVFERAAERARYEAGRALRQYDNIEPENRLVARTPEAVLEDKLAAVRTADSQLTAQRARRPVTLTDQETAWITTAGADLRAIFDAPTTTHTQRKELIRAVITEIVITPGKPADAAGSTDSGRTCQIRIIWQGGASTDVQMSPPASGKHGRTTSEDTIDLIRRLVLSGARDSDVERL